MADDLIKIPPWQEIAKLYPKGKTLMPFVQEIFLLECEVAGTGFVPDIETKAAALSADAVVALCREPDNRYDDRAIRIDDARGQKLGYIPRRENEVLSRLMDAGKLLYGKVTSVEISDHSSWTTIFIRVFMRDL